MTIRPASHADIAAVGRYLPAWEFRALAVQLARGPAWAVIDGDEVLALGGLIKSSQGIAEFWMRTVQGVRGSGRGVAVMALVRRRLKDLPADLEIVAHVRPGNRAGRVIARYMGLRFTGSVLAGVLEEYRRP